MALANCAMAISAFAVAVKNLAQLILSWPLRSGLADITLGREQTSKRKRPRSEPPEDTRFDQGRLALAGTAVPRRKSHFEWQRYPLKAHDADQPSQWRSCQSELVVLRDDRPKIWKAKDHIESGQQADCTEKQDSAQIGL
jgi:hypothetical protein